MNVETTIRRKLTEEQWQRLKQWCQTAEEREFTKTKTRQIRKFNYIRARHQTRRRKTLTLDKVVINLSSKNLNEDEKEVLALGLNFAPTPMQNYHEG